VRNPHKRLTHTKYINKKKHEKGGNFNKSYGARARAGGTCLVAVLHAASVIGCWGRAAGAASIIVRW